MGFLGSAGRRSAGVCPVFPAERKVVLQTPAAGFLASSERGVAGDGWGDVGEPV